MRDASVAPGWPRRETPPRAPQVPGSGMALSDVLLGRPLASNEGERQELTVTTGVPVLGLDALASTGYGPEAALTVLTPLGVAGLHYMPWITAAVLAELAILYLSYRQTQAAYPSGGGAYLVAKHNLGLRWGVVAGVGLLLDYLLNVAVAIAAGVGAVVSAIPALHPHTLAVCLVVLAALTIVNLRGVRESGLAFVVPVAVFLVCMTFALGVGLERAWASAGHPVPVAPPPPVPDAAAKPSTWLLLTAFANGLTAMTGIEATTNGVPLFRKPKVRNAHRTLTVIAVVLGVFLLAIAWVSPPFRIGAMNEREPGYQTVLSQIVAATFGHGAFYYVAVASIFTVLTFSAQTSFADFPRVCRFLAEDSFLPPIFAKRGRRLVFSHGIVILAVLSGALLVGFRGITDALIPLFAVGAFTAFVLSQAGMVVHWLRRGERGRGWPLVYNAVGAVTTAVALAIIVVAKFVEGAWLIVVVAPACYIGLQRIRRHYRTIEREIQPLKFRAAPFQPPIAIVPIEALDGPAEKALRFALSLSDTVMALHVSTGREEDARLPGIWAEKVERPARAANLAAPRLEIVESPFRKVYEPIVEFVQGAVVANPGRLITVVLPELVNPRWYEALLHNFFGMGLKTLFYVNGSDRVVVVYVPWYLRDR